MKSRLPTLRMSSWIRIGVIAAVLVTTLVLLAFIDHYAQRYARLQAEERLQQMAWQMRDSLDRGIRERFVDVELLSSLPAIRQANDPAGVRKVLGELQRNLPYYAWIGLTDAKGTVLAATQSMLEGKDVSERPWFQNAQEQAYAGDYHPALLLEKKLPQQAEPWRFIDVATPILNSDGKLVGVLGTHLSWRWARDLAQRLFGATQKEYGVEVLIVRKDGTVLLGPTALEEKTITASSFQLAQKGQTGALDENWPDGHYITGFTQTNQESNYGLGWSVLVRQPINLALAEFEQLESLLLWGGAISAVVLAILGAWFARRLAQPLDILSAAVERRARGDEEPIPEIKSYREIALLSSVLSDMVAVDKRQRHALSALNESLEAQVQDRTAELRLAADQLQEALLNQTAIKEELQRMVLLDALTGLPNRRAFHDELPRAMSRVQRNAHRLAVLFLDLDGFKAINDTYGHEAGDAVLCEFAKRISASVRDTDMVARLAGDEFTVILEQLLIEHDALEVAQKIQNAMQAPFAFAGTSVTLSSSVGVAMFPMGGQQSPDQLIHAADQAMYVAKRGGKNRIQLAE